MTGYSPEFFQNHSQGSYQSAKAILPIIFGLISPKSVVDVGCGNAPWLLAAQELGATDILGVDGEAHDPGVLMIAPQHFMQRDLTQPFGVGRNFDLAICVEVAEHLPESASEVLVNSLTELSKVILFSAAIPDQGGLHHVNEQWPPYWERLFTNHGFELVDCIRWRVWDRPEVDVWYAQNCLLYVQRDYLADHARLSEEHSRWKNLPRSVVHPRSFADAKNYAALTPRPLLRLLRPALKRTLLRRLSFLHSPALKPCK